MAPVRLAAGAVFALSGAASWLLRDPWTQPPPTCGADFNEDPEPPRSPSPLRPHLGAEPPPVPRDLPAAGCTAVPAAPTSAPSVPTRPSTASSAVSPPAEGPAPPRRRGGAPPRILGTILKSGNESDSWPYHGWKWVLWSLWSWCGPVYWRIGAAARAAGYLMVSSVTLFVLYRFFVVWTCVRRRPTLRPSTGDWCGPESPRLWTPLYAQKNARARLGPPPTSRLARVSRMGAYTPGSDTARSRVGRIARASSARVTRR